MTVMQDSETVFRLIYRSHSRIPDRDADAEMAGILRGARTKNAAAGITGALLYYDHWFAQVLEGRQDAVLALFERIRVDPRHDAVTVSLQGVVPARSFARWAMAHVGEHGNPDIPLTATRSGLVPAAAWTSDPAQEAVLTSLRDLTRGYGIGA
jgi:hypothetical protein